MTPDKIETLALQMAKADPRLAGTERDYKGKILNPADNENYFTLNQLVDAYRRELSGGQGDSGETSNGDDVDTTIRQSLAEGADPEEVRQLIIDLGRDPADYDL